MSDDRWVPKVGYSYRFKFGAGSELLHVRGVVDGDKIVYARWSERRGSWRYHVDSVLVWRLRRKHGGLLKSFKTTNSLASIKAPDKAPEGWLPKVGYSYRVDFLAGAETLHVTSVETVGGGVEVGWRVKSGGAIRESCESVHDWLLWRRKGLIKWSRKTSCVRPDDV